MDTLNSQAHTGGGHMPASCGCHLHDLRYLDFSKQHHYNFHHRHRVANAPVDP